MTTCIRDQHGLIAVLYGVCVGCVPCPQEERLRTFKAFRWADPFKPPRGRHLLQTIDILIPTWFHIINKGWHAMGSSFSVPLFEARALPMSWDG
jgi:hypothetical protein